MVELPGDPDALARVGANGDILARLADGAARSRDGVSTWSPDGWVLRTHPDLSEALVAATLETDLHLELVYGIATIVDPGSLIVAVGMGTSGAWLRVPDGPAFEAACEEGAIPVEDLPAWLRVEAWRVDLGSWIRASAILARDVHRSDA